MDKKYTAHILSHTHWDREWYLNSKYTNEWLIPFFKGLFAMMEKEKDYIFILDGQLSMVEDYFEELAKNGYDVTFYKRQIIKHVSRKRLFIGPYYLQPDWQLLSDEALVRNMMLGMSLADELGGSMNVGWMLDNFGQISQTAQIHKLCGLEGLYAWRGVEMDPHDVQSEFLWESPDGTSIPSIYLLDSYRNVMRLAEYEDIMTMRVHDEVDKLRPFAQTSHILLMNGYDQEMIPDDIQPAIQSGVMNNENLVVKQSDPETYIRSVLSENPSLNTLKGALYSGRFISVFPGVMSVRMYLKQQNDQQQKALEKQVEPLSSLLWALGGGYEQNQITLAWKTLLKNHPHDSICGVSIDDVHKDMEERSRQVYAMTSSLTDSKLAQLASLIDTSAQKEDDVRVVFNPALEERDELVWFDGKARFVKGIPSFGYKIVSSEESATDLEVDGLKAENSQIQFALNEDASFNITYKASGRTYENLGLFEDRADTGDEYNYSYPDEDKIFSTKGMQADITVSEQSASHIVYRCSLEMELPESDADGHTRRSDTLRKMPLVTYVTVKAGSARVECQTHVRNTVKDHLFRVLFPSSIATDTAYAGSPFDITPRPIHIDDYDESGIPADVKKVIVGAREARPNTIFLNRELLDLNDGENGLSVLNKGLPEYQVIGDDNTMALTLFRSVGWIAKEINSRIGDAGPEIFTPDAQCLRDMVFDYAVYPHSGNTESGQVSREASLYNTEVLAFTTDRHKGKLADSLSWFKASDSRSSFRITALKRSEDGLSLVVRGYNSSGSDTDLVLDSAFLIKAATRCNVREQAVTEGSAPGLSREGTRVAVTVRGKEILSLSLELADSEALVEGQNASAACLRETYIRREDFSAWQYASYVTDEDIAGEVERADELKKKIDNPMFTRSALEAQLSVILAQHRQDEHKIRALGYGLNEARVQRRVYDYIKEYKDPETGKLLK